MTVLLPVQCPFCHSTNVIRHGKYNNKQRYRCCNQDCPRVTFSLNITERGRLPEVKKQIIEMSLNNCGTRDIARVLKISTTTVTKELKKNRRSCNQSIKPF